MSQPDGPELGTSDSMTERSCEERPQPCGGENWLVPWEEAEEEDAEKDLSPSCPREARQVQKNLTMACAMPSHIRAGYEAMDEVRHAPDAVRAALGGCRWPQSKGSGPKYL